MTTISFNNIENKTIKQIRDDLKYFLKLSDVELKYDKIIINDDDLNLNEIDDLIKIVKSYCKNKDIDAISINL